MKLISQPQAAYCFPYTKSIIGIKKINNRFLYQSQRVYPSLQIPSLIYNVCHLTF